MSDVTMPQLGESVTEGTITQWFKQPGDTVEVDEPLLEVSTDKVDTEVPSPVAGVLVEIRADEGDTIDVGGVIAVIGNDASESVPTAPDAAPTEPAAATPAGATAVPGAGEAAPSPEPIAATPPSTAESAPVAEPTMPSPTPASPPPTAVAPVAPVDGGPVTTGGPITSPMVRRILADGGVDPTTVQGTGPGGRITRDDAMAAVAASGGAAGPGTEAAPTVRPPEPEPPTPSTAPATAAPPRHSEPVRLPPPVALGAGDTVLAFSNIRRRTGEHMVASKATAPHVITAVEVDFEAVEAAREAAAADPHDPSKLTYLPFVARAAVDAISEFPLINASVGDDGLIVHRDVNLSIAVDLNFEGLLAPVLRHAGDMRLRALGRGIAELASRARSRGLTPDDLSGGTFTLSNSGTFGTLFVAPIINQPQVAILSTDGVVRKPVVVSDVRGHESIAVHSVGNLTMSWDHRAFDGAYAAAFLARMKSILAERDWIAEL